MENGGVGPRGGIGIGPHLDCIYIQPFPASQYLENCLIVIFFLCVFVCHLFSGPEVTLSSSYVFKYMFTSKSEIFLFASIKVDIFLWTRDIQDIKKPELLFYNQLS